MWALKSPAMTMHEFPSKARYRAVFKSWRFMSSYLRGLVKLNQQNRQMREKLGLVRPHPSPPIHFF